MTQKHDGTARIRELLALDRNSIPPDGGERFNRLIFEASPYLLQHAENPVDWRPWGDEAFAVARQEDKPVFLSIGYATCHWCHIMEHESFEDPEVAAVINEQFVPIKVDREERPDIDDQYMLVSQMMTGNGGWPLNIVMTPDRQPFFAITYMPKIPRMGMPGIIEIMENIATLWRTRRDLVLKNCASVMEGIALQNVVGPSGGADSAGLSAAAWKQLKGMYDPEWGGFGGAPKFPMPHYISYLLLHGVRTGDAEPLRMAEHTLEMMRRGGIFDQLGFGFHRYAVDRQWLVPHFEKMLYDQALIAGACLDAYRVSGKEELLRMAEEILAGVAADLTSPDGGFYTALDADSEGEEGKCYLWTPDEIRAVLGEEEAGLCCRLFDITVEGNFEGSNILHLARPLETFAAEEEMTVAALMARLEQWRLPLLNVRSRRVSPLRDEKILLSWNGLMIATLADAYAVTGREAYRTAATRAVAFIESRLVTPEGRLIRSRHGGHEGAPAFLEDYAFFVRGLIALHQATLDGRFLAAALRYTGEMLRLFSDPVEGGLFDTGCDREPALVRMKGNTDGVIPSGNAVAALNLLRLGRITEDDDLSRRGAAIVTAWAGVMARVPVNHIYLLTALDFQTHDGIEIDLTGKPGSPALVGLLRAIHRRYLPGLTLRFSDGDEAERTTVSVCASGACRPPVDSVDELERLLDDVVRRAT
jgi:uncharacterized protein YyaL (SSP411 family)